MKNNKFLTSCGQYGIDFNQIDRIQLDINDNTYTYASVVLLYVKNNKYPIIVLPYDKPEKAKHVFKQLQAVVNNTSDKVIVLDNYRKE